MARFFAVRQQGGEASGHAYNRRTLSGRYVRIQKKGLSPKRKPLNLLERETGFEPATSTLARLHSTTELLPLSEKIFYALLSGLSSAGLNFFAHHPLSSGRGRHVDFPQERPAARMSQSVNP